MEYQFLALFFRRRANETGNWGASWTSGRISKLLDQSGRVNHTKWACVQPLLQPVGGNEQTAGQWKQRRATTCCLIYLSLSLASRLLFSFCLPFLPARLSCIREREIVLPKSGGEKRNEANGREKDAQSEERFSLLQQNGCQRGGLAPPSGFEIGSHSVLLH